MNIPAIGVARGVFNIFIPGLFLFLNLGLVVYVLPFVDKGTKDFIESVPSSPALILVVTLGFGYLIGVLLRLFRTELPDKWSAAWLRRFHRHARKQNNEFALWAIEEFPYVGWIGEVCDKFLPPDALEFYEKSWAPRKRNGQNRQFFNFCKVMINSVDKRAASEINAAEALSRYVAAMFFALALASPLILATIILHYIHFGEIVIGLVIILLAYLFAVIVILNYLRFLRIKEVEIVFAASYKNKSIFEEKAATAVKKEPPRTCLDWLRELLCPKMSDG